jgi:predicted MFS family arabinose efflux permease
VCSSDLASIILALAGGVCLAGLIIRERKHPNPSVPINIFVRKRFRTVFVCMALLSAFATCGAGFIIVYAQQVMQVSTQLSSTVSMPMTIAQTIFSGIVGVVVGKNMIRRFRPIALLAPALATVASLILFTLTPDSSITLIYAATFTGGMSLAISMTYNPFMQTELQPEEMMPAMAMYSFGSTGGACIFAALAGVILNLGYTLNYVFLLSAVWCAAAFIIGFLGFKFSENEIESARKTA